MSLDEEARRLRRELEELDGTVVRVALFGQPGAGKSSLINEILSADEAQVGIHTDTTTKMSCHTAVTVPDVQFCDLPGYGTTRFPKETYFERFAVDSFDVYICVSSGKLVQADSEFFRYLLECGRPCVFVFNKHDQLWQKGKTTEQLEQEKRADIRAQVGRDVDVLFTSCRPDEDGKTKGIEELKRHVFELLDAAKQDRWARSMRARTEGALQAKKAASRKRVNTAAMYAVANGALNPVPGVNLAVDRRVIDDMKSKIRHDYGLTDADIPEIEACDSGTMNVLSKLMNSSAVPGGRKAAEKVLANYALPKALGRFLPLVGNIIGGGLSLVACVAEGNAYVDCCHAVAERRLQTRLKR
ncbi:50S ribosome-binding GTPase [Deinococcus sp. MIMF12]|uniref:50S ribosome-binding GTPase n=1 Tax=Deinococcus rhizophilus TaxID=3049544 RepID=A0ABT7JGQ7_9DEIO|nr:GTPase [Deinococcus rhizophilus]MDL2344229.1 50S ribosome-binding GTPase [Deinococcus rhizophilus]